LLHLLAALREPLDFQLTALHVHHGLSPHADAWAETCRANCAELGVSFSLHKVHVEASGRGVEAGAREARYACFAEAAADFIVLAHHLDDQVETFFLRLLRGAGVEGLSGMPSARSLGPGCPTLLRPLLTVERDVLKLHAKAADLVYCDDESNLDQTLRRNFLRHAWLPQLSSLFPAYRRTVARAADHLREDGALLAELAALDAERIVTPVGVDCRLLGGLSPARARNFLRHWLAGQGIAPPSQDRLADLLRQVLGAGQDAALELRLGGHVLRRHKGALYAEMAGLPPAQGCWPWQGEDHLDLGEAGRLEFEAVTGEGLAAAMLQSVAACVRLRSGGERIQPDCRRPRRLLKKILQECGVPAWERPSLPVLWVDDKVAWVAGVGVDCRCQAAAGEPGWLISWRPPRR